MFSNLPSKMLKYSHTSMSDYKIVCWLHGYKVNKNYKTQQPGKKNEHKKITLIIIKSKN